MVGYSDPCSCCGHKRRLPASFSAAAARSPQPAKIARSIPSLSPSASALAIATLAPLAPLAPALTPSDPPAPAPTENVIGAPPLPLPLDSFLYPAYPTTAIPAPAAEEKGREREMVGYSDPCPCCGHKRRLPASFSAAAARFPQPAKIARSIPSLSPSASALAIATLAPLAPLAPALTPSDPPAPAPTENIVGALPLPLPLDSFLDPAYPTTAIPAPAAAVSTPTEIVIKVEVIWSGTTASVAVMLPGIPLSR